ncbi:hypothetical protein HY025_02810 [Candidatus Daviesbacteria bacterium]|nr:hypothetical protein [Candidatus Daviesbacteria bacterium]
MKFYSSKPHYEYLHKKWTAKHKDLSDNLIDKHLKHIALGSLGGLMLLTTTNLPHQAKHFIAQQTSDKITSFSSKNIVLANKLKNQVPSEMRNLTPDEEKNIENILTDFLGSPVKASVDNIRLNRTFGLIGGEQHLYRYPGDNIYAHAKSATDWAMFGDAGIAPHLGAWGYFASSKEEFDKEAEDQEKWYIAVQTFLSPGFAENFPQYRDFFKYRKMLVVNPDTGQAVVADIADAGPSEWTGKHLGGSPEVMQELGLAQGPRKGAVLYFFIDDKDKKIPLGPVKLNEQQLAENNRI